jgi:hypothetical protein
VLGFALLLLAMLSRLSRVCALLFGFPRTIRISEEKARGN